MLSVKNLQVAYGRVQALWGVSLDVAQGEIVALVGANGAGKTTLLKAISGIIAHQSGAIVYNDRHLEGSPPREIVKSGIVHVPEGRKLFPEMTVMENLLMGSYLAGSPDRRKRLDWVFQIFPLLRERHRQLAGTMSGGEQQMLAIGRGLMAGPKLLMLDEPSLVEQNTEHALALAHKGFVMELGRVTLRGTGEELLANSDVRKAYLGL
jgi:branched-chain amino acid transport system ATP-binding protein